MGQLPSIINVYSALVHIVNVLSENKLQSITTFIIVGLSIYTFRHYCFTLNRLFGKQRHPYQDIDTAQWPTVTVFIAAHNEEAVIADSLRALLETDYPSDRLEITPVNDRSSDRTKEIIDEFVDRHPGRIRPFHRISGKPGKAAALKDATKYVTSEIIIIFDADYIPSKGLVKNLVSAFFDPEIGAVMGRVVPLNVGTNLLTRLLDLERAGGYQIDQQARMNLRLVPQYGGTVGGIRMAALHSIGGWHDDVLAEDTDITYRLLLNGWKTAYQNRCECYEEVPEAWMVRLRQIKRWAKGHNQALVRHVIPLIRNSSIPFRERFDGFLLLIIYILPIFIITGWLIALFSIYYHLSPLISGLLWILASMSYSGLGNFATFFGISAALYLDDHRQRTCLFPFIIFGLVISFIGIFLALFEQMVLDHILKRNLTWDKTARYRTATPSNNTN